MALKNDLATSQTLLLSIILVSSISVIAFDWRIILFVVCLASIFGGFLAFISVGFMDLNFKTRWK